MENKFVYPTDIIGREHCPDLSFDRVPEKVDWNYLKTQHCHVAYRSDTEVR